MGVKYILAGGVGGSGPVKPAGTSPSVSVIIPVLNEAGTIGRVVSRIRQDPNVLEVIVVDDGSIDGSAEAAALAGAQVATSTLLGKGASMEDGVGIARGDVVLFLDGDLLEFCEDLVTKMTAPIVDGDAELVKAKFSRDAGRVTVLTARPLLGAFFPELARFDQPLGGIVAIKAGMIRNLRLENDYGVDVGLLIDAAMKGARVTEVDIGHIDHESQSLEALGEMAKQVTRVILDRAWRNERLSINLVREMEERDRRARAQLSPRGSHEPPSKKFALFDMDGVLLDGRFVEALANQVGAEGELSRFLDNRFLPDEDRTQAIASLFTGVGIEVFEQTARSMPLMEGAVETVVALRRAGYIVGIVTDSFHVAAETIRRRVFADFAVAHLMRFHHLTATGEVILSPAMLSKGGCARHDCCKANVVRHLEEVAGLSYADTMAVGDGENDVCMLRQVGIPIAFRPKADGVRRAARWVVTGPLSDVLFHAGVDAAPAVVCG
jgi:glucosyl-3-phosphoglycerate synthase